MSTSSNVVSCWKRERERCGEEKEGAREREGEGERKREREREREFKKFYNKCHNQFNSLNKHYIF